MKSVFEIITVLVFLLIITLFQKMDDGWCDSRYNTGNAAYPATVPPLNSNKIMVPALYKQVQGNAKSSPARVHSAHPQKG